MSASHSTTSCCFDLCRKIIGWIKYYMGFSRPAIFLIGLVVSHGFVDYAIVVQLVIKLGITIIFPTYRDSAAAVNAADGIIAILFVILAHLSETYTGGFAMIVCTTIVYFVGLLIIPLLFSKALIYIGLGLMAIGKAGQDPLDVFLVDQLSVGQEERNENTLQKCIARAGFYWFVLIHIGYTLATTSFATSLPDASSSTASIVQYFVLLVGGYLISIIAMFAAFVWFLFGTCCGSYYYRKPAGSPFTTIYKVFKAAIRKRHMDYPNTPNGYFQFSPHHPILRWIDKAAIIEPSSNQSNRLEKKCCSIPEVKKVKRLLTLIPLWTTFIVYSIVHGTGNTFLIVQGIDLKSDFVNHSLPITIFFILRSFISSATSLLFSSLLPRTWSVVLKQRVTLARITSGMALSILYCLVSWQVEVHRLKLAKVAHASSSKERHVIPMSIFWLTPQFVMLGLMDGLVEGGLNDFYDNYIDKSMKRFRRPFNVFVLGTPKCLCVLFVLVMFKSWFSGLTVDESHLDRYFLMLAILSCGNLCLHAFISYKYTSKEVLQWKDDDGQEEPQQMNGGSSDVPMGDQFSL